MSFSFNSVHAIAKESKQTRAPTQETAAGEVPRRALNKRKNNEIKNLDLNDIKDIVYYHQVLEQAEGDLDTALSMLFSRNIELTDDSLRMIGREDLIKQQETPHVKQSSTPRDESISSPRDESSSSPRDESSSKPKHNAFELLNFDVNVAPKKSKKPEYTQESLDKKIEESRRAELEKKKMEESRKAEKKNIEMEVLKRFENFKSELIALGYNPNDIDSQKDKLLEVFRTKLSLDDAEKEIENFKQRLLTNSARQRALEKQITENKARVQEEEEHQQKLREQIAANESKGDEILAKMKSVNQLFKEEHAARDAELAAREVDQQEPQNEEEDNEPRDEEEDNKLFVDEIHQKLINANPDDVETQETFALVSQLEALTADNEDNEEDLTYTPQVFQPSFIIVPEQTSEFAFCPTPYEEESVPTQAQAQSPTQEHDEEESCNFGSAPHLLASRQLNSHSSWENPSNDDWSGQSPIPQHFHQSPPPHVQYPSPIWHHHQQFYHPPPTWSHPPPTWSDHQQFYQPPPTWSHPPPTWSDHQQFYQPPQSSNHPPQTWSSPPTLQNQHHSNESYESSTVVHQPPSSQIIVETYIETVHIPNPHQPIPQPIPQQATKVPMNERKTKAQLLRETKTLQDIEARKKNNKFH